MINDAAIGSIFDVSRAAPGFTFSFAHGPFTRCLWSHFKIKAKKSESVSRKRYKKMHRKKRVKKNMRDYAHINPFHNLDVKSDRDK